MPITLAIMGVFGEIDAALSTKKGARLPTSDLLFGSTATYRGDEIVSGNLA